MTYCLIDFPVLTAGKVSRFTAYGAVCQKFYDMGLRKNADIQVLSRLPFSKNVLVTVGGESLVLREEEARCLEVCTNTN